MLGLIFLQQKCEKLLGLFPGIPRRVVAWKARKIPKQHRRRMLREVLADLRYLETEIEKFNIALGFNWSDIADIPDIPEHEENEVE